MQNPAVHSQRPSTGESLGEMGLKVLMRSVKGHMKIPIIEESNETK